MNTKIYIYQRFSLFLPIILLFLSSCSNQAAIPDNDILISLGFRPIPEGSDFPDISFSDTENRIHSLSEYKGSVILLNFWASWCPPCRGEMPAMENLADELKDTEFVMLPINVQESADMVESFTKEFDIGFPVYLDIKAEAAKAVGVTGLPTSILIDRDGKAIAVVTGALEWDSDEIISMMKNWTRR